MSFFWDGTDWQYKTKDSLPGNMIVSDKDGNLYTVSREEPTNCFESLGLHLNFANTSSGALYDVTHVC